MQYVFDRDFDAEARSERRVRDRISRAIYTPEDLEQAAEKARAEGYADGRTSGRAEANIEAANSEGERQLAALEAIGPALGALFEDADRHRARLEQQMLQFVLSVFEQLAPDVFAALARGQAERQAQEAIRMALGSATIHIFLPPEVLHSTGDMLKQHIRLKGYSGRVDLKPDPAMAPGDVRVAWDHGVMTYSFDDICNRILAAIETTRDRAAEAAGRAEDADQTPQEGDSDA